MNASGISEQFPGTENSLLNSEREIESRKRLLSDEKNDFDKGKNVNESDKEITNSDNAKSKDDFPMTFNLFNFRKVFGLPPPKYKEFVFTSRLGKKIRIRGKKKDQKLCFNVKTDTG